MARWQVKVCSSNAQSVTMQAGPSSGDNDVFATWHPNDGQKLFDLPARIQSDGKIFFKATTPGKDQTDLCVLHDGTVKKKMSFDGGDEDHDISAGDNDNCSC
jgi:hypothetical protein